MTGASRSRSRRRQDRRGRDAACRRAPIGLGHTRWATHGGVTEPNAHPHLDCTGRLAIIHNGIVANHRELRDPLARAGHRFRSETDTEVVAHLLEEMPGRDAGGPRAARQRALMAAFRRLEGLNAIAVLDVPTGQLAAAKNGSPLIARLGRRRASCSPPTTARCWSTRAG